MNQPVGHIVSTSTNEKPSPSTWVSNARRNIRFVRATAPALCTEPRATYAAPSSRAIRSPMRIGYPWYSGVAAVERVLRALPDDPRGRHVAAGLAEHAVVEQDAGDALAARRGVQHLLQALVDHVAVALEGEHDRRRGACASRRSRPTARGRAAPARGRRPWCPRSSCSSRCRRPRSRGSRARAPRSPRGTRAARAARRSPGTCGARR